MLLGFQYESNRIIVMLIYLSVMFHSISAGSHEEFNIKTNLSEANNIDDPPEVQIESGKLIGTFFKTAKNRKVYKFEGVPYAAPPINKLRFKEPHPVAPWSGKLNANKKIKGCSQFDHFKMLINPNASIAGQEDCLYLNIYTPQLHKDNSTDLLDVVVFIHGGAFMFGSAKMYTPKYLLDKMDLVFVSINYRLGPFGFMTMDDDIIPGNNGLKDQVFALKWIKNNIKQFSGDPNKVTLTGMSAGGASVHYHYLSKQSRNLFSKGISLSGLATNCWALMEEGRNKTIRLAESLGCESNNSSTLLRCLRDKTDYEILSKIKILFMPWQYNPFSPFGPTIERAGNNPFLSENPFKMLAAGETKDAPLLLSTTSDEGLYPGAEYITNNELLNQLSNDWYKISPHLLDFNFTVPIEKHNVTSKLILDNYFNGKTISTNTSKELIDLLTDRLFITDIGKTTKLQAISMKSDVFMFKFSFRGRSSVSNMFTRSNKYFGVSHGDDLPYILGCYFGGFEENYEEMKMVELMGNIWTSFIKNGIPDVNKEVTWHPVSKSRNNDYINYLNIKSHKETQMVEERDFGKRSFWDSLTFRENNFFLKHLTTP